MGDLPLLYGSLTVSIVKANGLKDADGWGGGESDPYVQVYLDRFSIARTRTVMDDQDPVFGEVFELQVNGRYNEIIFKVRDHDPMMPDDMLGYASIPLTRFLEDDEGYFKGEIELGPEPDEEARGSYGTMKIKLKYTSQEKLFASYEVPDVSFSSHHGCRVTLFQDAHIGQAASLLPPVRVVPGVNPVEVLDIEDEDDEEEREKKRKRRRKRRKKKKHHKHAKDIEEDDEDGTTSRDIDAPPSQEWEYKRKNCWEKIYKSILHAKHFIYITGWSVDTSISLLRERPIYQNGEGPTDDDNGMLTIGELLKKKALEGVTVCLLLWNEATSVSALGKEGLMFTHDEFTRSFFEGSGVLVNLAYRDGDSTSQFLWTHHQKSVILDAQTLADDEQDRAETDDDQRRIIAFVGGLDLCDGRWDTPQHTLYRSLKTYHAKDFHQVWPGVTVEHGPREPWHDIHCRLEGPIARDVMRNFEQRWRKQAAPHAGVLVDIDELPIISVEEEMVCPVDYWDSWSVQLFRSIDNFSAIMENDEPVDKSIQLAYIHHIRRARRFIFIENQYFLGSSQAWENGAGDGIKCNNLIPLELTEKICSQIRKKEPFTVYVVLPMYPEGVPSDGAVQEILCWQHKTIEMMYARIYRTLEEEDMLEEAKPEDYLLFFCMGQRETEEGTQAIGGDFDVEERPVQEKLNQSRRFAIYVHSKMMIVDDDYVICGSANINERSMAGNRDSEIAMGAYQPHFTGETCNGQPRGQIHAFRMGLFLSHMRRDLPCFLEPQSTECARAINEIAKENWALFAGDDLVEMEPHGHLLKYPLAITDNGRVVGLPSTFIPDTEAPVIGAASMMLPDILTL